MTNKQVAAIVGAIGAAATGVAVALGGGVSSAGGGNGGGHGEVIRAHEQQTSILREIARDIAVMRAVAERGK